MSTEIKSVWIPDANSIRLNAHVHGVSAVMRIDDITVGIVALDRAEFLAAVRSELGAIVIDQDELPEVPEPAGSAIYMPGGAYSASVAPQAHRQKALELLAVAEYLEANPPVDEAQVEALTEALMAERREGDPRQSAEDAYRETARALVRRGVRVGVDQ